MQLLENLKRPVFIFAILLLVLVATSFVGCEWGKKTKTEVDTVTNVLLSEDSSKSDVKTQSMKFTRIDPASQQIVILNTPIFDASVDITIAALTLILTDHDSAYLLLNSPGGSVPSGQKLVNFIKNSKKPVYTVCVGLCASMAFHILETGKRRMALPSAILMAHPFTSQLEGTGPTMLSMLNFLTRYTDKLDAYAAKRIGIPFNDFKVQTLSNVWLDGEDAKSKNYVDDLVYITLDYKSPTPYVISMKLNQQLIEVPTKYRGLTNKYLEVLDGKQ